MRRVLVTCVSGVAIDTTAPLGEVVAAILALVRTPA